MGENEMSILLIVLYALMSASFFVLAALADGKTIKQCHSSLLVGQLYSYYNQRIGNLITTSVQEIGLQKTKK